MAENEIPLKDDMAENEIAILEDYVESHPENIEALLLEKLRNQSINYMKLQQNHN